jgi:hypothetical protein
VGQYRQRRYCYQVSQTSIPRKVMAANSSTLVPFKVGNSMVDEMAMSYRQIRDMWMAKGLFQIWCSRRAFAPLDSSRSPSVGIERPSWHGSRFNLRTRSLVLPILAASIIDQGKRAKLWGDVGNSRFIYFNRLICSYAFIELMTFYCVIGLRTVVL